MGDGWRIGGSSALARHAPFVQRSLAAVVAAWPDELSAVRLTAIRTVTAEGLGLVPLRRPPSVPGSADAPEAEVMAFAEQFAADVTCIDDELRADARAVLGAAMLTAAYASYVADAVPRARAALDGLFGPGDWYDGPLVPTSGLGVLVDELVREVSLLDALDPVTVELVRLRGARLHQCRVCLARRSLDAIEAGADAATFQAVDHYRGSVLTPGQQAALGLVDGIVLMPADLRGRDLDAVREHLTPAQAVSVVLHVTRDAVAKVVVALGTDAAPTDGLQLFGVDRAGNLHFP